MGYADVHSEQKLESERGNTLVEVLVAVVILGLTVTAVLGNLLTTTSVSVQHRNTANFNAALVSFAETARNTIELQNYNGGGTPPFRSCASGYTLVGAPIPSSGPPGTVVTVLGTGFTPTSGAFSGATFNGTTAGFTSQASASSGLTGDIAQFTVPNSAVPGVSYPITPFDGTHSAATSFTVTAPPGASSAQTISGDALTYDTFTATCTTESADVEQLQFDLVDNRPNNGASARQTIKVVNLNPQGLPAPPVSLAAAPPTHSPTPPSGVTGQLKLTWYPPTFQGLTNVNRYTIYRSTAAGTQGASVGSVSSSTCLPQCSYTDSNSGSGLSDGTVYYYEVTAVSTTGASQPSSQASGTTLPGVPATPTPTSGTKQVNLSWTAPAGIVSGYNVYCSTTAGSIGTKVNSAPISGTSYSDSSCNNTALTDGNHYYYEVTALNASGEGSPSTQATGITLPGSPQNVAAVPGTGSITVSWTAPTNGPVPITGYNVYCSTTPNSQGSKVNSIVISASPYSDTTCTGSPLANGTTYYFEVTTVNAGGESNPSTQTSATLTAGGAPSAPQNLVATGAKSGSTYQVNLTWNPPASGTPSGGYNVYCSVTSGVQGSLVNTTGFITATSYTATSCSGSALVAKKTYYFEVTAVNSPNLEGPPTTQQPGTTPK